MEHSHRFFSNRACAYFPCHEGLDPENFNCLFCFCPLYGLRACGGSPAWLPNGVKDCSGCLRPHRPEGYEAIIRTLKQGNQGRPHPQDTGA